MSAARFVHPLALALCLGAALPAASFAQPICDQALQQQDGGAQISLSMSSGILQPIAPPGTIAGFWLQTQSAYTSSALSFVLWDPVSLIADPTTVALRAASFDYSACIANRIDAYFAPPIVTARVAGLADPPRPTVAFKYQITFNTPQTVQWNPNGGAAYPIAYSYFGNNAPTPLGGTHPVAGHQLCADDGWSVDHYVMQSVMTATVPTDTAAYELVQGFRVPQRTVVHWLELALSPAPARGLIDPIHAWIVDAVGGAGPGQGLALGDAQATVRQLDPGWMPLMPMSATVVLEPNHDYWLVVRTDHDYSPMTRILTGTESTDFTSTIGSFHRRNAPGVPYTTIADRRLSFRLIGAPEGALDVPGPRAARLALRATPNPSRDAVELSWSDAEHRVRIDVLDLRGRRVASATIEGESGRWTWRSAARGTFFARLTDAAGRVTVERVVRVR